MAVLIYLYKEFRLIINGAGLSKRNAFIFREKRNICLVIPSVIEVQKVLLVFHTLGFHPPYTADTIKLIRASHKIYLIWLS